MTTQSYPYSESQHYYSAAPPRSHFVTWQGMNQGSDSNRPVIDQEALNFGSQSEATTIGATTRNLFFFFPIAVTHSISESGDDEKSAMSVYSYRSEIDELRLLRQVDGRVCKIILPCSSH
jgi:hypothetical protein